MPRSVGSSMSDVAWEAIRMYLQSHCESGSRKELNECVYSRTPLELDGRLSAALSLSVSIYAFKMPANFTSGWLGNGERAWHGMGVVTDGTLPAREAFETADALFTVEKRELRRSNRSQSTW